MGDDSQGNSPDFFSPNLNYFCEGKQLGLNLFGEAHTEVVNTVTSLAFVLCGLWGLFRNGQNGPLIVFLYSLLTMTGVGSALYHFTFYYGFGLFDGFPMSLMMTVGLAALADELVTENVQLKSLRSRMSSLVIFFVTVYGIVVLVVSAANLSSAAIFRALFALPFVGISVIFIWLYYRDLTQGIFPGAEESRIMVRSLVIRAFVSGILALILWSVDLAVCDIWPPIVYMFGHGWWHILIPYCALCMFSFISYLRADNYQNRAVLSFEPSKYFPLLPVVNWEDDRSSRAEMV